MGAILHIMVPRGQQGGSTALVGGGGGIESVVLGMGSHSHLCHSNSPLHVTRSLLNKYRSRP